MPKSIVFCFTGTGNSLKVSKDIAAALGDCGVYHMGSANAGVDISASEHIGFVFPVYFVGLPNQVRRFIEGIDFPSGSNSYIFAIGTYANAKGNAVRQVDELLRKRGQRLSNARYIKMGDNAIAFYGSRFDKEKLFSSYDRDMANIISQINEKQSRKIGRPYLLVEQYHNMMIPRMLSRDAGFQVSDACTACNICKEVCPVKNINIVNGKPEFKHACEQCMGCIQLCPQRAIDYKGKCSKRNRYRHPDIGINEIVKFHDDGKII